ncbi:MAG: hypothetical protein BGO49_19915 [Planctomycetales bacterium 71-10]|nr:MAG: hypothetical protein BGO49_19915 [Planctomycetales bacterium 71-10]
MVVETSRFGKDLERQLRRGRDPRRFAAVMRLLVARQTLPAALRDHALTGPWSGCRDCHVEPDWILIYEVTPTELILHRTGTHSDLF